MTKNSDSATIKSPSRRKFLKVSGLSVAGLWAGSIINACTSIVYVKEPIYIKNQLEHKELIKNIEDIPELKINNSSYYINIKHDLIYDAFIIGETNVSSLNNKEKVSTSAELRNLNDLVEEYSTMIPNINRASKLKNSEGIKYEYKQMKLIVDKINYSVDLLYEQIGLVNHKSE